VCVWHSVPPSKPGFNTQKQVIFHIKEGAYSAALPLVSGIS
jgi:hypothetical protein